MEKIRTLLGVKRLNYIFLVVGSLAVDRALLAEATIYQIPDEYEVSGDQPLAMGGGGVAVVGGLAAVRTNPAQLALEKQYEVGAGYHWPTSGRDFYQAGIVDSKTSTFAAGVAYTGFAEKFDPKTAFETKDSFLKNRLSVALAKSFGGVALGALGQYLEAHPYGYTDGSDEKIKGTTLGFGAASSLNSTVRFAGSVENIANSRVQGFAPRVIRGGGSYLLSSAIAINIDYRQRERVDYFEVPSDAIATPWEYAVTANRKDPNDNDSEKLRAAEKMVIGSFSAKFQDTFRILGGYGQALSDSRKMVGGGAAVVSQNASLTYAFYRPYLDDEAAHQSIQLNLAISL
jgi:hypothetical protein